MVAAAYARCLRIAQSHYENFPVASRLLPKHVRPHIAAIYAFARIADDFADEGDRRPDARLALLEAVRSLPEREARIIKMRHGLDGSETLTLREVSEELGISQERDRQVEIKALRTIRTGRYASTLRRALSEAV